TLTMGQMERLTARAASKGFASLSRDQTIFTLFETVLAAWVHRVAATDELVVGVATHGRQTPAERAMAGCFVDLFPVDVALDPWETFTSLYAKLRTRNMEVLRHARPGAFEARGDAPFSVVVNHVPLRFAQFEGAEPSATWLGNGHVDPVHAVRLNLLDPGPDGALTLKVLFNAEVVPEAEADAALGHLMKLLDVVLDAPETAIGSVALAAESDASQQLLTAPLDADEIPDILAAFDAHCRADPSADLVSEGSKVWSRQDVRDRASAVAELLVHEGIGPNARIGIHLPRSVDLIAALVGVLKVGAAFVPLDPTQPDGRLDEIAEEARLSCLITTRSIDRNWPTPIPSIRMEDVPERASQQPSELASGPAYVLFTSGSTGRPKGVQVGRAALSRYAHWAADTHAGSAATWALHSAIGFDLTLTSIFAPLASGGSIRIYREAQTGPDLAVLAVFEEDAVDIVKLTPRHLTLALEAGSQVTRIRSLVLGGEELTTALAKRTLKQAGAHIAIHNEYGPTEAVVGCMDHVFDPTRDTDATVPIGHAASATRITVRDPALNPVPDGVIGALYVSGIDRLADGYLGRRTETAARFVTDPTTGERMYDTGDLASVRADGVILYHGRGDDQLKRAGLRIERGELVHAALTADGVSDCAVVMYDPEAQAARQCKCCGITDRVPDIRISEAGLCELCSDFDRYRARAASYFGSISDIHPKIADARARKTGKYDCVILLSGGKDSTYAVAKMAEITQNMLCVTLDNGFIAEEAKTNIRRITAQLGLDHRFLTTPAMADIFVDSLKRHSNVCQGCFKTIYTMALQVAREVGAPMIVTGLSRGQLFETRLAPELFKDDHSDPSRIDGIVLEARRTYHAFPDAVTKRLNGDLFDTGDILSEVEFLDFYRYCDVPVSEVYRYLDQRVGWVRPSDSGRSTNCLINDLGIYVHKAERRHHNYALPYSWDVRMGHKTKEECLDELDDEIDMDRISAIMEEIGYDGPEVPETGFLTCYYVGSAKPEAVRAAMARHVPRAAIPPHIVPVSKIPLNANGKVDTSALPSPIKGSSKVFAAPRVAGEGRTAQLLAIWQDVLKLPDLAPGDNFYDIGGSSIAAIQISTRAQAEGIKISPIDIFRQQSIAALVAGLGEAPKAAIKKPSAAPRVEVSAADKAKLAALLGQAGRG
ncbi:MAG: amino acid adenylation domain-containing protein, partial [Pseudomonadota bacterium]